MKRLTVFIGSVHSGKTTRALEFARRLIGQGHDLVAARPRRARREHEPEGFVVTKGGERWPIFELDSPLELGEIAEAASVVWIDEPMLFTHEQQIELRAVLRNLRRTAQILVSGLGQTSELKRFGSIMAEVLCTADRIIQCYADCQECGGFDQATRSYFRTGPKAKSVSVGGSKDYDALCSACWNLRTAEAELSNAPVSFSS
jgi:thymidine kinase